VHELNLATEIYRTCRATIDARGRGRLESVRVAVGELSAIEPELLVYAWEAVVSGGPDQGAKLEVEWHSARQVCPSCGQRLEHEPGAWLRLCPSCGGVVRIEGGDEMDVVDLTYTPDEQESTQ
jgi:hydrogenase nickel incorporation protein HypA/HybF